MKRFRHFRTIRTLQTKFLLIVLPPLVLCALAVSLLSAYLSYRSMKENLTMNIQHLVELQSNALALSLWNYLNENVQQSLEVVVLNSDISKATVYKANFEFSGDTKTVCVVSDGEVTVTEVSGPFDKPAPDASFSSAQESCEAAAADRWVWSGLNANFGGCIRASSDTTCPSG